MTHYSVIVIAEGAMTGLVAGAGLGLLFMLATLVGQALDRGARETAWRNIAAARRVNNATVVHLQEWAANLDTREKELDVREWRLDQRERKPDTD